MKRAKLHAAIAGGSPDDIEQNFYEALHNADIEQLMGAGLKKTRSCVSIPVGRV